MSDVLIFLGMAFLSSLLMFRATPRSFRDSFRKYH